MFRCKQTALAGALTCALGVGNADAVTIALHTSNQGISAPLGVSIVGTNITIRETWTSTLPGVLIFDELVPGTDYTVVKEITNNSGSAWARLANELLDPLGQSEDSADPLPYPSFVPLNFSTSNDNDGLSFAQGSGIPRTSTAFSQVEVDEDTDVRDFLDYFNGSVPNGGSFSVTFGLRENFNEQQPFLLIERPNAISRTPVPEPTTLILLDSGLAGGLLRRRFKKDR